MQHTVRIALIIILSALLSACGVRLIGSVATPTVTPELALPTVIDVRPIVPTVVPTVVPTPAKTTLSAHEYPESGFNYESWLELYYEPSPDDFTGWATRNGQTMAGLLWWVAHEAADQYEVSGGYMLYGGGEGFVNLGGENYLMQNRASLGFVRYATRQEMAPPPSLNEQQHRLLALSRLSFDDFIRDVSERYVGVIATKSPNDLGREFCLSWLNPDTMAEQQVGTVIVGDVAALDDWTPLGGRDDPLSLQTYQSGGRTWHWAAELPTDLWYLAQPDEQVTVAGIEGGGLPIVRLQAGRCFFEEVNRDDDD